MSVLSAMGSRPTPPSLLRTAQDGTAAGAQPTSASGKTPSQLPPEADPVSLSSGSVAIAQHALNAWLVQLGDQTVEVAQRFVGNAARSLFGDAATGASFQVAAISVAADTSMSAAPAADATPAAGSAAALQLNASAAFIGNGTITTGDGQSFNFQLEVSYTASAQSDSAPAASAKSPDTLSLTGQQLPEVKFPGSLADLFKLLGRQLEVSTDSGKNDGNGGDLSLRLIRLVNSAALLAPRARADSPEATPVERNRALASYAPPAPSSTVTSA